MTRDANYRPWYRGPLRSESNARCGLGLRPCIFPAVPAVNQPRANRVRTVEPNASFAVEHCVPVGIRLFYGAVEGFTLQHHRLHTDFSAVDRACVRPFDRLPHAYKLLVGASQIPWLDNRIDEQGLGLFESGQDPSGVAREPCRARGCCPQLTAFEHALGWKVAQVGLGIALTEGG